MLRLIRPDGWNFPGQITLAIAIEVANVPDYPVVESRGIDIPQGLSHSFQNAHRSPVLLLGQSLGGISLWAAYLSQETVPPGV